MNKRHAEGLSRREFLGGLALAGTAGLLGLKPGLVAAEPPPETTTLRLNQSTEDWYTRFVTLSATKGLSERFFALLRMT